jgi:CheY-like chemotaxis protein
MTRCPNAPASKFGHVMVVDDSKVDRMICQRAIMRSGLFAGAIMFDSGRAAQAHLLRSSSPKIDLILLDVNMPGLNGFEFVEQLYHAKGSRLPPPVLLMLTIEPPTHLLARVRDFACFFGTIAKPITPARLVEGVKLLGVPQPKEIL